MPQIVDRYVEGLAKNAQKQKGRLHVERNVPCPGLHLPQMRAVEYFVWEANHRVHTLAGYSPVSDRLIFLRVMGHPDEEMKNVLPRLFNALQDTPPDTPQTWSLYDFTCVSPAGYNLETFELKSGHIRLHFLQGSNIFQVDRLSLAQMILKNRTLEDWYRDFFKKDLRHTRIEIEPMPGDAGATIAVKGSPRSRWRSLLQPLPFWRVRPRLHLEGRVWVCPVSNKIFTVQTFWKNHSEAPDLQTCSEGVSSLEADQGTK